MKYNICAADTFMSLRPEWDLKHAMIHVEARRH